MLHRVGHTGGGTGDWGRVTLQDTANVTATGGPWSGIDDEPSRNWTEGQPEPACPQAA